jgi:uncharacterized protein (TIGR02996 family)
VGAFAVIVSSADLPERRLVFTAPEVSIGRVHGCDVVLGKSSVSRRHARLVVRDDVFILVDLKSANGTYVNGNRIVAPVVVRASDRVAIGEFTLAFEDIEEPTTEWIPEPELDSVEAGLLASIAERDEAARVVYADWLEERGDLARAEFLRLQQELLAMEDDGRYMAIVHRLEKLAAGIDVHWRIKVGRPVIENCMAYDFPCPREWGALDPTGRRTVRFCTGCERNVYYCKTIEEARDHARRGDCVCVDPVSPRRSGDLDPPRPVPPPGGTVFR